MRRRVHEADRDFILGEYRLRLHADIMAGSSKPPNRLNIITTNTPPVEGPAIRDIVEPALEQETLRERLRRLRRELRALDKNGQG